MEHPSKSQIHSISNSKFSLQGRHSELKSRVAVAKQQYEIVDELDSKKRKEFPARTHLNTLA